MKQCYIAYRAVRESVTRIRWRHDVQVLSIVALTLWAGNARTQSDLSALLDIERRHAVYVSSGVRADGDIEHAVVVNQWTRPLHLEPIYPRNASSNLTSQIASALQALDVRLAELGATRASILQLNAFIAEGSRGDPAAALGLISDYLNVDRPSDYHSCTLNAVFETGRPGPLDSTVVLDPTILDPRTSTSDQRADPAWSYQPQAQRWFLIGPARADTQSVPRYQRTGVASDFESALQRVRELLNEVGARREDINEMAVYFDGSSGVNEMDLIPILNEFFPHGLPLVDYVQPQIHYIDARAVSPAAGAVTVEASGITLRQR